MIVSLQQLVVFLLIVGRIAGVFIQAPLFSTHSLPFLAKTALAVWLSIVLWFVTPLNAAFPNTLMSVGAALVFEVALGFVIGFFCNIIFLAVQSAGEIMDMQMGLSVASALDPVFGSVISIIGRLTFFLALILFIAVDGHHLILSALHQSFVAVPAGKIANLAAPALVEQTINLGSHLWLAAMRLAAPVVLLVFISDFSFGIVSRVAPQVNVFMLGFEVKPMLGLLGFSLCLPFFVKAINSLIDFMLQQLIVLSQVIK